MRSRLIALSAAVLATVFVPSSPALAWTAIPIAPEIAPSHYTAIYDSAHDQLVAFGGTPGSYDGVDVLRLSVPSWAILRSPRGPSSLTDPISVLDPVRERMLIIGGSLGADVWELPLDSPAAWHQLAPEGPIPAGWSGHSAVYDPVRDRVLVFGGTRPGLPYSNEVWALTLSPTIAWELVSTAGGSPAARRDQSAIYDPVRDRLIICDGATSTGAVQDVWALSLSDPPVWNAVLPAGVAPVARSGHAAVYDPVRDRLLLASGRSETGAWLNDLWSLTLAGSPTWTQLIGSSTEAPLGRTQASLCYDSRRDRLLLFGGQENLGTPHDTWSCPLTRTAHWTRLVPDWGQQPPFGADFVSDPQTKRVFGISGNAVWQTKLDDPASAWSRLAPLGPAPSPTQGGATIFDSRRNRIVVFSGSPDYQTQVWALGLGPAATWELLLPSGSPPVGRSQPAAVYDSLKDRMVIFGGSGALISGPGPGTSYYPNLGDATALEFSQGAVWSPLPSGPPARLMPGSTIDQARNRMLVYGGAVGHGAIYPYSALGDLWEFDLAGDAWRQIALPGGGPAARWKAVTTAVPELGELGILGGAYFNTPLADVWGFALDTPVWLPQTSLPGTLIGGTAFVDGPTVYVVGSTDGTTAAWKQSFSPRPTIDVVGPGTLVWTAGVVNPLSFRVSTSASGPQTVDYTVSCDRAWPGFPFTGFLGFVDSMDVPIGVPVPDTAAAGVATIRFVVTLRSDPAATDSCNVRMYDPASAPPAPVLSVASSDTVVWSWTGVTPLDFKLTTDAPGPQVVDYGVSCDRQWPGFPFSGSAAFTDSVHVPIGVAVPETASAGVVTIRFAGRLRSTPAATDTSLVRLRDPATAPTITLVLSEVTDDGVRVIWATERWNTEPYEFERRTENETWQGLRQVLPSGTGLITCDDHPVAPGHYHYRLSSVADPTLSFGETTVDLTARILSLRGAWPNPAVHDFTIAFTLPTTEAVRIELFDVAGRRVLEQRGGDLGPGAHTMTLTAGTGLLPGIYIVRISQGDQVATARVAFVR